MQMQDRVAMVTGGASGIGRGISLVLAQRGVDVALIDIDVDGAKETEREIVGIGRKAAAYRANVASAAEVEEAVDSVVSEFGRIDVLVNAAGVIGAPGWEDSLISREVDWDITFDVNVKGTVIVSDAVSRHMKARRSGKSHMTTREIFDEAIRERCPLGREQTPEDIGKAVAFFASDDAFNITGQSLNVNGGTRTD